MIPDNPVGTHLNCELKTFGDTLFSKLGENGKRTKLTEKWNKCQINRQTAMSALESGFSCDLIPFYLPPFSLFPNNCALPALPAWENTQFEPQTINCTWAETEWLVPATLITKPYFFQTSNLCLFLDCSVKHKFQFD